MIELVEVRDARGAVLALPLEDSSSEIIVQSIEGLEPVKANLVSSTFALIDGAYYQSSRREPRNIILNLGFSPDWSRSTVTTLRHELYSFFMPESEVTLTFIMDTGLSVSINGRVESFNSPLFAQEPSVAISIMCFDPDFYSSSPVVVSGQTVETTAKSTMIYPGTIETGAIITYDINRAETDFTIENDAPDGRVYTTTLNFDVQSGDQLIINSSPGSKEVVHVRGSARTPVLYAMKAYSDWFKLLPGRNLVRLHCSGAPMPYTIEYMTKYGGL